MSATCSYPETGEDSPRHDTVLLSVSNNIITTHSALLIGVLSTHHMRGVREWIGLLLKLHLSSSAHNIMIINKGTKLKTPKRNKHSYELWY